MYPDRLDGRITSAFFNEKSKKCREQDKQLLASDRPVGNHRPGRPFGNADLSRT